MMSVSHMLACDGCGSSHNDPSGLPWYTLTAAEKSALQYGWRRHPTTGRHWCPSCQRCERDHELVPGSAVCVRCGRGTPDGTTEVVYTGLNVSFRVSRKGEQVIFKIENGALTATFEMTPVLAADLARALQRRSKG